MADRTVRVMIGGESRLVKVPEEQLLAAQQATGGTALPSAGVQSGGSSTAPPPSPTPSPEAGGMGLGETASFVGRGLASGAAALPALGLDALNMLAGAPSQPLQAGGLIPQPAVGESPLSFTQAAADIAPVPETRGQQVALTALQNLGGATLPVGGAILSGGLNKLGVTAATQLSRLTPLQLAQYEAATALISAGGEEAAVQALGDNPVVRIASNILTVFGLGTAKALGRLVSKGYTGGVDASISRAVNERVAETFSADPAALARADAAIEEADRLKVAIPGFLPSTAGVIDESGARKVQDALARRDPTLREAIKERERANTRAIASQLESLPGQDGDLEDVQRNLQSGFDEWNASMRTMEETLSRPTAKFIEAVDTTPDLDVQGKRVFQTKRRMDKWLDTEAEKKYAAVDPDNSITFKTDGLKKKVEEQVASVVDPKNHPAVQRIMRLGDDATFTDFRIARRELNAGMRAERDPIIRHKLKEVFSYMEGMLDRFASGSAGEATPATAATVGGDALAPLKGPPKKAEQIIKESLQSRGYSEGEADNFVSILRGATRTEGQQGTEALTQYAANFQEAATRLREANAWFRPRVQALRGDVIDEATRLGRQGIPKTSSENLVGQILSEKKGGEELRNLINTFREDLPEEAQALEQTALDYFRKSFYEGVTDPSSFKMDKKKANAWIQSHQSVLKDFPEAQLELSGIARSTSDLSDFRDVLKVSREAFDSSEAARVLKAGTPEQIRAVVLGPDPTKNVRKLSARLQLEGDPNAQVGLKRITLKALAEREGLSVAGLAEHPEKLQAVLDKGRSTLEAAGYQPEEITFLQDLSKAAGINERGGKVAEISASEMSRAEEKRVATLQRFFFRAWGKAFGRVGTPFLLAVTAAENLEEAFSHVKETEIRAILGEALVNPKVMQTLRRASYETTSPRWLQKRMNSHLAALGMRAVGPSPSTEEAKEE